MNSLTQFLVDGILLERIEKTIVVYSGRFQPFHKGHFATYENLIKKFGKDSVYIATSNKTDNQKSPFNFKEKKLIMQKMFGIPSNKIVEVRNPYAPMEVLASYPEETTGFITVVGEKDEMRLSGKYFTPYKGKVEMGYKDKGYVYASPAQPNPISGTEVRNWLKAGDEQSRKDFLKAYPKFDENIFKLITLKLSKLSEEFISEIASTGGIQSDGEADSGYSPDGTLRIINRGKPEPWLKQLGMKQIDKPRADNMRGVGRHKDKESQFRKLYYKVQNIKGTDLEPALQPHKVEDWEEVDGGKKVKKIKRFWEAKENEKHPKQQPQPYGLGFDFDSVGEPSPYLSQPKTPNTPNASALGGITKALDMDSNIGVAQSHMEDDWAKKHATIKGPVKPFKEDKIPGGLAKGMTLNDIAKKHNISVDTIVKELKKGMKIEMEHTTDVNVAKEIAFDHLYEDPQYYDKLSKIENENVITEVTKEGIVNYYKAVCKKLKLTPLPVKFGSVGKGGASTTFDKRTFKPEYVSFDLGKLTDVERAILHEIAHHILLLKQGNPYHNCYKSAAFKKVENKLIDRFFYSAESRFLFEDNLNELNAGLYAGTIKIGGTPVKIEVELVGADNKTKEFITKVIHIDKQYQSKLPIGSTFKIPARIFRTPGGGWYKIKHKAFEAINTKNHVPDKKGGAEDAFNHHHKTSTYSPDYGHPAELDTIDFDDNRKKQSGHQSNTTDTEDRGYEPIEELDRVFSEMAKADMDAVEKYADAQMSPEDIELGKETDHFFQRLNDPRNGKEISPAELTGFFKRLAKNKKKFLEFLKQYKEFVVTDNRSNINIAFLKVANKLIAKTVMRKADFKSATPIFTTEVAARYIEPKRVEAFLKKYPKVEDLMQKIVDKVKDVDRGYQIFLHYKEDKGEERYFGGKKDVKSKSTNVKGLGRTALNKTGKSFNSKTSYKYEWDGKMDYPTWGEVFQYIWNKKYQFVNESLLMEGGAYGHMNHPFDVQMNLTFGDLKNIVKKALSGKLELAREKTDGQALAISWVNGRLVAARNKSHLKNSGKDAMGVQDVISKFAGRGSVSDAFSFAIKDLESAVKGLSDKDKKDIFKDGKCFMNCEIIYPENTNVVPYGTSLLVFHGTMEYNEAGDAVGENPAAGAKLAAMVKKINADVQSKFTIQGPPIQKLPVNKDLKAKQPIYLAMITKLQNEFGLTDKNGVADYHQAWWRQFVDKNAPSLDEQQKIGLVKRWAFGDKSFRLADIKDAKLKAWADQTDKKDQAKITKDNLLKFEEIFLGVGADVLSFMTSVLTANPEAAKQQMVGRLETAISSIKATGDAKNLAKLEIELARLNALGGFEKIVPNEGIVFSYKGATYKLTGAFAPLNQILGIFTFSR
jgi:hypothetical protein